jgi:Nucleoside diphosphate kinase
LNVELLSYLRGPVWVYVLERRRAVEVWKTLMGDADPLVARELVPDSLRALYGLSAAQNGLMGSPDSESAEVQISSLFASSPPFPVTDLPDATTGGGSTRSMTTAALAELQSSASSLNGYARSNTTNPSTAGGQSPKRGLFKARSIPSSHVKPDIVPRTTRAANLRAGIPTEKTSSSPRAPLTKEAIARTFANVPGHKRAESIVVASTAPPVIAPRMTRAASFRLGQQPPPKPIRTPASSSSARPSSVNPAVFEGVPGHKRRESITVASTKAPTMAPRSNRSATLRLQKETAPPSSFNCRFSSFSFRKS